MEPSRLRRRPLAAGMVLLPAALWLFALHARAQPARVEPRRYTPPSAAQSRAAAARAAAPGLRADLPLPAPAVLADLDLQTVRPAPGQGRLAIGLARQVPRGSLEKAGWQPVSGSRDVWRLSIRSPGAVSVRVHFTEFAVGGGRVWLYGAGGGATEADGPYTARGLHGDGEFWSSTIPGDTVVIEYEPDQDAAERAVPFSVREISHHWLDPALEGVAPRSSPKVAACHLDYSCYPEWSAAGQSVAHYRYVEFPYVYACTGSLLSTRSGSLRPYFLTANHCVSTASQARSVEAYWFHESQSCGGAAPALSAATRISGANLLVTRGGTEGDFTLLQLAALPSRPVWFAGWDPAELSFARELATIHHPEGSYKRIAFSRRAADEPGPGGRPADRYYQVAYTAGRTDFGSSGAPLFYQQGGSFYLAGSLSFGDVAPPGVTVCEVSPFRDGFGRFSVMYPVLRPWLEDQAGAPVVDLAPARLDFGVRGLWLDPPQRTVRITTNLAAPAGFSAAASAPWVRLSKHSGTVSAAAPADIDVSVDAPWFPAAGEYSADITVIVSGQRKTVGVSVSVRGPRVFVSSFRNAASYEPGLVAGSLATVTGQGLAPGINGCVSAGNVVGPWPTTLAGVQVQFGDHLAPVLFVCNVAGEEFAAVQTPWELGAGTVWARVQAGQEWVLLNDVPVLPVQPGIFENLLDGRLRAVLVKPDGSLVTPASGVRRGARATAYVTGLGPVLPPARTNQRGVPGQLAHYPVAVRLDGTRVVWPAAVEYAPNLAGVYLVTFDVPADAPLGTDIPFEIAAQPGTGQFWVFAQRSSISIAP